MKMHWAREDNGQIVLRITASDAPLAIVGRIMERTHLHWSGATGFTAVILRPGYPDGGPFKTRGEAVVWTQAWVTKNWFPKAVFVAPGSREAA